MSTIVLENSRLELLRRLAEWRDMPDIMTKNGATPEQVAILDWSKPILLGGGYLDPEAACGPDVKGERLYENAFEDIALAARECAAIGQIELHGRDRAGDGWWPAGPACWAVKITDLGYSWIKAHDAVGEAEQEVA